MRRLVAAAESEAIGYGGISAVARATGVSRRAITEGAIDKDPTLLADLDRLVDPATRGDPGSPLRWTCKSVRTLAEELQHEGHAVSYQTVTELLHAMDYSLQANQKRLEGSHHADRDQQFEYINRKAQRYLRRRSARLGRQSPLPPSRGRRHSSSWQPLSFWRRQPLQISGCVGAPGGRLRTTR